MVLNLAKVRTAFNQAANTYNSHAILQREIADRLLDRLIPIILQPQRIVECGARTGYVTQKLLQLYPQADVISIDVAWQLLSQGIDSWHAPYPVCADLMQLPLAPHSVDLLIANLALHWLPDYFQCLAAWQYVLKPNGLLLFTTLGRDTLGELRASFAAVSSCKHVHDFIDMHDLGDALLAQHWLDPVMDCENITVNYRTVTQLLQDLKYCGVTNAAMERSRSLMGKQRWQHMLNYYQQFINAEQRYPATFEVIYGHAWYMPSQQTAGQGSASEFLLPISKISRSG